MADMFYVYILKSVEFDKFYTGKTDNLERRLKEHNLGKSHYTKRYKPWKLIYREEFLIEKDAVVREKYLKSASGRRWLKKDVEL